MIRSLTTMVALLLPALSHAQDAAWQARLQEANAMVTRGEWTQAVQSYEALTHALAYADYDQSHSYACEHAAALLHTGADPELAGSIAGDGFAVAGNSARRHACESLIGLGYAAMAQDAHLAAPRRSEVAFRAALWLGRARASGEEPALAAAYTHLPAAVRTDLESIRERLRTSPVHVVAAQQRSVTAMAERLVRVATVADPTRVPRCFADMSDPDDPSVSVPRGLATLNCSFTVFPQAAGEMGTYPVEIFFLERVGSSWRAIGSASGPSGSDCSYGLYTTVRRFERLTRNRSGLDGSLYTWTEGYDPGEDESSSQTYAAICNRDTLQCRRIQIGETQCAHGHDHCRVDWLAEVSLDAGRAILTASHGTVPPTMASIDLSAPIAAPQEALPRTGCRLVVRDPHPPLNVRTGPSQTSAVGGTLADGVEIHPRERRNGWLHIETPVAGWVFSRNVQRVCPAR